MTSSCNTKYVWRDHKKNFGLTLIFALCLSVVFSFFFFPFITPSFTRISKALHNHQYRLVTLRDWIFHHASFVHKIHHFSRSLNFFWLTQSIQGKALHEHHGFSYLPLLDLENHWHCSKEIVQIFLGLSIHPSPNSSRHLQFPYIKWV
jgi:hypothetical protein